MEQLANRAALRKAGREKKAGAVVTLAPPSCVVFDGATNQTGRRAAQAVPIASIPACSGGSVAGCMRVERRHLDLEVRPAFAVEFSGEGTFCNLWHSLVEFAPQWDAFNKSGYGMMMDAVLYVNASTNERRSLRPCRASDGILHFLRAQSPLAVRTDAASTTCPRCHSTLVSLTAPTKAYSRLYASWTRQSRPITQFQRFIEATIFANGLLRPPRRAEAPIQVLILTRHGDSRRFLNEDTLASKLESLCRRVPFAQLQCRMVDTAHWTIPQQMAMAIQTDVLVGAHGAGLTWFGFMRQGSIAVEITHASSGKCIDDYVVISRMAGVYHTCETMPHGPADPGCDRPRERCVNFRVDLERLELLLSSSARKLLSTDTRWPPPPYEAGRSELHAGKTEERALTTKVR